MNLKISHPYSLSMNLLLSLENCTAYTNANTKIQRSDLLPKSGGFHKWRLHWEGGGRVMVNLTNSWYPNIHDIQISLICKYPWCQNIHDIKISMIVKYPWYSHIHEIHISMKFTYPWNSHIRDIHRSMTKLMNPGDQAWLRCAPQHPPYQPTHLTTNPSPPNFPLTLPPPSTLPPTLPPPSPSNQPSLNFVLPGHNWSLVMTLVTPRIYMKGDINPNIKTNRQTVAAYCIDIHMSIIFTYPLYPNIPCNNPFYPNIYKFHCPGSLILLRNQSFRAVNFHLVNLWSLPQPDKGTEERNIHMDRWH